LGEGGGRRAVVRPVLRRVLVPARGLPELRV